jgi:hypothetical protein
VSLLYNLWDKKFQDDLVVQFIQSIGLYPTGTLVELTTGDVGIVVEQHSESRLTPKVAVLDQQKAEASGTYILVDLKDENLARKILEKSGQSKAKSVSKLAIARDLELSGYDVDIAAVTSVFMKSAQTVLETAVSEGETEAPAQRQGGFYAALRDRLRL